LKQEVYKIKKEELAKGVYFLEINIEENTMIRRLIID